MNILNKIESSIEKIPESGCWIWMKSVGSHGYGQIMFPDHKPRLVHRLSYEAYIAKIPDKLHVLHKCDVRSCCNPAHLFIGTAKDNMQDCKKKKRNSPPPIGQNYKLTVEQRKEIRNRKLNGESTKLLAFEFKVDKSRILQLARDKNVNN